MRISRIGRHGAFYDAPIPAQTVEGDGRVIFNPIDFDNVVVVNIEKAIGDLKSPKMKDTSNFYRKDQKMRTELI